MNTQNKPDRAEVIAEVKEWISNGKITLVGLNQSSSQTNHMRSRIDLLSSALQLLEEDGEDAKRLDWLEERKQGVFVFESPKPATHPNTEFLFEGYAVGFSDVPFPTIREAIDSAMASTSTTEEESA